MTAVLPHAVSPEARIGVAEYLALERRSDVKHEFEKAWRILISGGTPNHNRIALDVSVNLVGLFGRLGNEVFGSDQRVRVAEDGPYYYPDVVVAYGEGVFDDEFCLLNPLLAVEVFSESIEERDRTIKFRNYRRISTLRHCVLIAQDEVFVEHWAKDGEGRWVSIEEPASRDASPNFAETGATLPLANIYRRVVSLPENRIRPAIDREGSPPPSPDTPHGKPDF